mgnify:CR=1 FL=1
MKKKLLYIDPNSYSNMEIYGRDLLNNVEGYEILFAGNKQFDAEKNKRFNFIPLYSYNKFSNKIMQIISYFVSQIRLVLYVFYTKPDIIHIQWLKVYSLDVLVFSVIKKITQTKIVFTAHNILPHDTGDRYLSIFNKMYLLVDGIVIHSKNSYNEFKERFNHVSYKVSVIDHGLLDYRIKEEDLKNNIQNLRHKLNVDSKVMIYLLIGKMHYYKGYDLVIDAWINSPELNNRAEVCLIIAGSGNIKELELVSSSDNIHIINEFLSDIDFVSLINLSDVVLFPYRKISQSGVLSVVLNEKKASIVSNVGGLSDIFEIGKVGGVFKTLEREDIESKILEFIKNGKLAVEANNYMKEWSKVHDYLNWSRIGKLTSSTYNEMLGVNNE